MYIISGMVCSGLFPRSASKSRTGDEMKTGIGETPGTRGMWETVKGWFSMYEIKEPACHGGYFLGHTYGQG